MVKVDGSKLRPGNLIIHEGHASPLIVSDMRSRTAVLAISLNGNSRWIGFGEATFRVSKEHAQRIPGTGYSIMNNLLPSMLSDEKSPKATARYGFIARVHAALSDLEQIRLETAEFSTGPRTLELIRDGASVLVVDEDRNTEENLADVEDADYRVIRQLFLNGKYSTRP